MNGSDSSEPCGSHYTPWSLIAQAGFVVVILFLDLFGNLLVCVAIYRYRRLRSVTNYLIGSLAVSDLLVACLSMPFRIYHTLHLMCWDLGLSVCKFWIFVDALCSGASICNLSLIAIDRYLVLSCPFSYREKMRKPRGFIAILAVWLYAFVIASLSLTEPWSPDGFNASFPACAKMDKYYYAFAITMSFFLPLVVLIIAYSMVFKVARKQACLVRRANDSQGHLEYRTETSVVSSFRETQTRESTRKKRRRRKSIVRELKATKTLSIVIGTFITCWAPFFIIMFIVQFCHDCVYNSWLTKEAQMTIGTVFVYVLPLLNSAANPIIYSKFNADFRLAFKDILMSMFRLHRI
ncbi:tyramine receptor 1 [Nematostella vectensis]|uniref:tyramine receptor 1 n=1 Tax=Nematostella vectensis TaxID=45351 RepID=UPI00207768F0|nr:tyramine receptor 1 [Nematostella vectensis]